MRSEISRSTVARRRFLCFSLGAASLGLLQACGAQAPAATQAPAPTAAAPVAAVPKLEIPTPAAKPTEVAAVKPTQAAASAASPTVAAPAATAAPAAAVTPAGQIKRGGTFTFATTAMIQDFNPVNLITGHYPFMRALYNTLTRYDSQLKPVPELAEKWDFSADGKDMTLKLREGIKYHSGREFTSEDVRASWEFATTNDKSTMRTAYQSVKKVETPSKYVAVLKSDTINPTIFDVLDTMYIIDKDTLADLAKVGNGTGPFKLDKYVPNDRVEYVAFKDYWEKGKPYVDRYVQKVIPDVATLAINLETGAVDCIQRPSLMDVARLKNVAGGKFLVDMGAPGSNFFDIALNVTWEPFTNKKVRQAIAWAIDRERFCKTTLQGLVKPTCLMFPPHSWAYFPDLEGKIGFDLDKSKALLKEAGLEKGFDVEMLTSSKRAFGYGDLAQILNADLAKIGVRSKIVDMEVAQYDDRMYKGDMQLMVHTYGRSSRDPGSLVTGARAWVNNKEGNWTHWDNAEWDKLRTDLNSTLDQEKRKAACRKLQEMALDECFTITAAPSPVSFAYASYVKGFGYTMDNSIYNGEIWLDK